jgi:hypothetical protein
MQRSSTAAEVQHGNPLEQLVSLVSPTSYMLSAGIEVLAADIHQQLMKVYRNDVMSRQWVAKRCHIFASGRDSVLQQSK